MSAAAPFTAPPAEREPRNWRTEHALMQATIDTQRELARTTARIAPAPTGSREIPAWLLAVLIVLTALALVFAPDAYAAAGAAPFTTGGQP